MEFNELKDLIIDRFACREFNDKKLDNSILEKIVELARFCPSACNSQPWKLFYTAEDKKIKEITKYLQADNRNLFLEKAKGYIALIDTGTKLRAGLEEKLGINHFVKYDVGEMTAYITLIAKSLGVDSCIIGWIDKDLNNYLKLENGEDCNIIIALGYSDKKAPIKTRKEIDEITKKL